MCPSIQEDIAKLQTMFSSGSESSEDHDHVLASFPTICDLADPDNMRLWISRQPSVKEYGRLDRQFIISEIRSLHIESARLAECHSTNLEVCKTRSNKTCTEAKSSSMEEDGFFLRQFHSTVDASESSEFDVRIWNQQQKRSSTPAQQTREFVKYRGRKVITADIPGDNTTKTGDLTFSSKPIRRFFRLLKDACKSEKVNKSEEGGRECSVCSKKSRERVTV
jgi:hypothetical protein